LLNGSLFTRDFLLEGIRGTAAWSTLGDSNVAGFRSRCDPRFAAFTKLNNPTEAETEKELIWPLLEALGWNEMSVQQNLSAKARDDVPDALLFASAETKTKAAPLAPWQRFQHGLCIVEAKRWNRVLDREEARRGEQGVPSTQMLRYLRRVRARAGGGSADVAHCPAAHAPRPNRRASPTRAPVVSILQGTVIRFATTPRTRSINRRKGASP
jgi:hypothetical protein